MTRNIPTITGEQMARIDDVMMREMGVDTLQLMELAGFGVADIARRHCSLDLATCPEIVALAGTGGNGGDAMVAARLLHAWGAKVTVVLVASRDGFSGIAAHQLGLLDRLGIPVHEPGQEALPPAELIIDGLLGFSLRGDPHGEAARLITLANTHPAPILAIDIPSGLEASSGKVGDPCIRAEVTVTLGLPKRGLISVPSEHTGTVWLADIGIPPQMYTDLGMELPRDLFAASSLIQLW